METLIVENKGKTLLKEPLTASVEKAFLKI